MTRKIKDGISNLFDYSTVCYIAEASFVQWFSRLAQIIHFGKDQPCFSSIPYSIDFSVGFNQIVGATLFPDRVRLIHKSLQIMPIDGFNWRINKR